MKNLATIWVTLFIACTAFAQTGIATARVSGVASAILSINSSLNPNEIRGLLRLISSSCEQSYNAGGETNSGVAAGRVAGFTAALIAEVPRLTAEEIKAIATLAFSDSTCGR